MSLWPHPYELSTFEVDMLLKLRGGCNCFIKSPCNACTAPLTTDEAEDLGLAEPGVAAPKAPYSPAPALDRPHLCVFEFDAYRRAMCCVHCLEPKPDYSAITRSLSA